MLTIFSLVMLLSASARAGIAAADWRSAKPDSIVDLRTSEGAAMVKGEWRVHVAEIADIEHHAPGADLKPTGAPVRTHDLLPHAGAADFDDAGWEKVDASSLETRRGNGRLSFVWYRINVTIPEKIGEYSADQSTAVFEIVMDDYAEVTVDGKLPQVLGQRDGRLVSGWNAPNRVILGRDVCPGEKFQIAVLGANAPLSQPPGNYIWIRSAVLKFYSKGKLEPSEPATMQVSKFDPALDEIIAPETQPQKLASGFGFTEGPVWSPKNEEHDGFLLFSDPNNNSIYRYDPFDGALSIFRSNSGYTGPDIARYKQPGSNGLALDPQGRLTINEHGNRRVTRLEKNGTLTVLADRYQGKRLNSPNDLVYRSDGTLYFTDPPFALPMAFDDPARELPFSGVFCLKDGELKLVAKDLIGPNGIAFSPDEKYLYVSNWDDQHKIVMRYEARSDGLLSNGTVFADVTSEPGAEALDGLKVDRAGNVFFSGPGGVWIFSPTGQRLGLLKFPELPANMAWGDADGKALYLTARTGLYRLRTESGSAPQH
jgi:gluconolactonase